MLRGKVNLKNNFKDTIKKLHNILASQMMGKIIKIKGKGTNVSNDNL
jgi:hypothetical protein